MTDDWYRDEDKAQGGWALELISANATSDCPGNWRASVDPTGGTPGRINSINNQITDRSGPRLITAVSLSAQELLLTFDEPLDPETAEDLKYYALTDGISPLDAVLQSNKTTLRLILNTPLQNAKAYTLTLAPGIRDCLGNAQSSAQQLLTGLPQAPATGDLIVNEILFNPLSGGSDFVELYNKSQKLISLRGMVVINRQKTSGGIQSTITADYLLAPGRYVAVAVSKNDIQQRYVVKDSSAIFSNALPTLDDDAGNITLRFNNITLDSFNYSNKLHSPLLEDEEGISLERLNFDLPTNAAGNWHSAAISAGLGYAGLHQFSGFSPRIHLVEKKLFSAWTKPNFHRMVMAFRMCSCSHMRPMLLAIWPTSLYLTSMADKSNAWRAMNPWPPKGYSNGTARPMNCSRRG